MEIEIPKSIKVGGKTYSILYPYVFTERTDLRGQTCSDTLEIKISDQLKTGEKFHTENIQETFIHEVLHAVDIIYNSNKLEEDEITRLGEGLFQVLKDNDFIKSSKEG